MDRQQEIKEMRGESERCKASFYIIFFESAYMSHMSIQRYD